MGKVNQEMTEHGDMVMLPVSHFGHSGGEAGEMAAFAWSEAVESWSFPY